MRLIVYTVRLARNSREWGMFHHDMDKTLPTIAVRDDYRIAMGNNRPSIEVGASFADVVINAARRTRNP
jgi:hypothetical protein